MHNSAAIRIRIPECPVQISSSRTIQVIQIEQEHIEEDFVICVSWMWCRLLLHHYHDACCPALFRPSITTINIPVMIVKKLIAVNTPSAQWPDNLLRSTTGSRWLSSERGGLMNGMQPNAASIVTGLAPEFLMLRTWLHVYFFAGK